MNAHAKIDSGFHEDLARVQGLISEEFGEFGNTARFEPGSIRQYFAMYEDRGMLHESDVLIPPALILAFVPKMRSESVIARIGLGRGRNIGIENQQSHLDLKSTACLRMRERVQMVEFVHNGWWLTCDHHVFDTSQGGQLAFSARLNWLHQV